MRTRPSRSGGPWKQLVDRGLTRQLGISNCARIEQLAALCEMARIQPTVLQNRFHAETGYDRELREFCRPRQIVYQSFWTLTANPQLLAHDTVRTLARHHGRTPAQILFRFLTQIGIVPADRNALRGAHAPGSGDLRLRAHTERMRVDGRDTAAGARLSAPAAALR